MMKHILKTGLVVAVMATAGMANAQSGEIFIPGVTNSQLQELAQQLPQNPLAACLANANAQNCSGIDLDPGGVELESFSAEPSIAYETLVFDLNGGDVATTDKPSDYTAAPPPDPYANKTVVQPTDPYAQPTAKVVDPYAKPVDPYSTLSLPAVAITIEFDFNSAGIRADQFGKLNTLAAAFRDPALVNAQFAVIGHTDAAGSDYYNCDLSRRRAAEVATALRANYVTLPLFQIGFGEHVLKNVYDPRAAENRRVTFLRLPADYNAVIQTSQRICGL